MKAHEENVAASLETVLRAITVMNIEIDDRDTIDCMMFQGMACRDRHVVEEAETHRQGVFCVLARRPHGAEGVVDTSFHHGINRGKHAARGVGGDGGAVGADR